ncbi:hypothetical protein U14_00992 [Candidatus Moduliflexus flocculans]|uniref:Uncharacterized protein n=1 Tax=Candidatus Moduliflexus flocculans TaxID=1499966 RepID=A0A0S6VR33_9BACT|nr:hypothetical protein U14_00992 [Candidatus Moduliflexus flocculans]
MRHSSKQHVIRVIIIVFAALVLISLIGWLGNGLVIGRRENQTDIRLEIGLWTKGTLIEQTFSASQNNLARIDFWIDSYRPWDSPFLECRLFELDPQFPKALSYGDLHAHLKEVRLKRLNGWLLSPHMFNAFAFEPISDSQGKRYLFTIQSPALKRGGSSIIMASPKKRLDNELFFINGIHKEGDLAFRAMYAQPRLQVLHKILTHIALRKPALFAFPLTNYLIFGGYFVMLVLLIRQL